MAEMNRSYKECHLCKKKLQTSLPPKTYQYIQKVFAKMHNFLNLLGGITNATWAYSELTICFREGGRVVYCTNAVLATSLA